MPDTSEHLIDFPDYLKDFPRDKDPNDPAHEADALLLTCMDFRFFLKIAEMMKGIKYDHIILAGAALGVVVKNPTCLADKARWRDTFFDHLELAVALHKIKKVIVLEHRDCGAYGPKGFCELPANPGRDLERRVHEQKAEELREQVREFSSDLYFCSFLMDVPSRTDVLTFDQLVCAD
jgi:carbonic anhydrase